MNHETFRTRKERALALYDELFEGVDSIVLLDVPDYPNVGDSAIFLGLMNYFEDRSIEVKLATSIDTLNHQFTQQAQTIVLMGGGSFGGLYPVSDEHRMFAMNLMAKDSLFIQCPQSVHFVNQEYQLQIADAILALTNKRISVRDESSLDKLMSLGIEAKLLPDSSVFLTDEDLSRAAEKNMSKSVVYLVREDEEGLYNIASSVDRSWLTDKGALRLTRLLRKLGRYSEGIARLFNPSPNGWKKIARKRLDRGLRIIQNSEIVVTDRLHGMLLALQAGKKVIALDNSNMKLSRYANNWLKEEPNLLFVTSIAEAQAHIQN